MREGRRARSGLVADYPARIAYAKPASKTRSPPAHSQGALGATSHKRVSLISRTREPRNELIPILFMVFVSPTITIWSLRCLRLCHLDEESGYDENAPLLSSCRSRVAAIGLSACGSSSSSSSGGSSSESDARRLLDAAGGLRKADPGVPGDAGRQGRELQAVLRPVRRTEPRGRQRPARRRRQLLARTGRRTARQGRPRLRELEPERHARLRDQLGRRDHRAQGQPEAHHRLGGPGQAGRAGRDAEPVHVGRRALEHHGRVRRAAEGRQDPGAGAGIPDRRCSTTSSARTARRATRCRRSSPAAATR